ncbi:MAG: hypothetical protein HYU64_04805 [Armatimonadetes bacterium]|nr:hypothetical protein [Armatimonadota bacterium]
MTDIQVPALSGHRLSISGARGFSLRSQGAESPATPAQLEQWDSSLSAGIMPAELAKAAHGVGKGEAVKRILSDLAPRLIHDVAICGPLGIILFQAAVGPVLGTAIGVGVALARQALRIYGEKTGTEDVNVDGKITKKHFLVSPEFTERGPEELRMRSLEQGKLGERIVPFQPGPEDFEPRGTHRVAITKSDLEHLGALGKKGLLFADFGRKSRYGHAAVNRVDATAAAQLMKSGQAIYVGVIEDIKEIPHHFSAKSRSASGKQLAGMSFDFIEKNVRYHLARVETPEQLSRTVPLKEGPEFPTELLGLYRDRGEYSEIIYKKDQHSSLDIKSRNSYENHYDSGELRRNDHPGIKSRSIRYRVYTARDPARAGALIGAFAACLTVEGMMLSGAPAVAAFIPTALAAGGAIGFVAGKIYEKARSRLRI